MQVEKSEKFVKAEDIKGSKNLKFKILDEPIEVTGDYGKKLETRILMTDGDNKAKARWSINNTNKDILIDGVGQDTAEWVGKELTIHIENIKGKDSIILDKEQF